MMYAQSAFRFCDFIAVSILIANVAVFTLRFFLRFVTFLVTRPWRRHRTFTVVISDHLSPLYCAVCQQEAKEGEKMRRLTICRHCFHADCIDPWLGEMSSTCPLCRAEIPPSPPEYPLLSLFFSAGLIDLFNNKELR
ncbi:unnamed protein product [Microthlaspi erraticum]|uniref:RING-type domain-containing protein n=1 Tax=Microthlaspi erraticum TaxID=1685480 RepID=A0A6D2I1L2_9BRAS|nr:unnamed protein product [Microthlaspi erraticum]CAA7029584.1 unnamed protein product [Microthlaspi erraticum]CAA7029585.1 unnamed protein product [Microthlaspi erraticum]